MTFAFKPARRENVSLLVGVAGCSGAGKTLSALKLATGLAGDSGRIAFIDTEAGRGLHYADEFRFDHGELAAPFSPERYREAIEAADEAGYRVIVIDSYSHCYAGDGGLIDWHDAIVEEKVAAAQKSHRGDWPFEPDKIRARESVGAWAKPKMAHKRLVSRLLQCRAHLIFCLRAEDKIRMERVKDGKYVKTVITAPEDLPPAERWVPLCEKRFPYELTLSMALAPTAPGVPIPIKLQQQHRAAFPEGKPVDERAGALLAAWARGERIDGKPATATRAPSPPVGEKVAAQRPDEGDAAGAAPMPAGPDRAAILAAARAAAAQGDAALRAHWNSLDDEARDVMRTIADELRETADAAGAAESAEEPVSD